MLNLKNSDCLFAPAVSCSMSPDLWHFTFLSLCICLDLGLIPFTDYLLEAISNLFPQIYDGLLFIDEQNHMKFTQSDGSVISFDDLLKLEGIRR